MLDKDREDSEDIRKMNDGEGAEGVKFQRFVFLNAWDWIMVLPTIVISIDEPEYYYRNFSIQLHWLGWHLRWRWIKETNR